MASGSLVAVRVVTNMKSRMDARRPKPINPEPVVTLDKKIENNNGNGSVGGADLLVERNPNLVWWWQHTIIRSRTRGSKKPRFK